MSSVPPSDEAARTRYPSLAALQAAHADLLKRLQAGGTGQLADLAEMLLREGIATGELLAEPDERRAAQAILDFWAARMYRVGAEPPDSTLADFNPQLAPELLESLCPYLGLEAFHERDGEKFFGRRELISQLIARLNDHRLIAVIGSSGSGKSSVVRAGLIPSLRKGALPGSQEWHYLPPIVPGSDPLANLDSVLRTQNEQRLDQPGTAIDTSAPGSPIMLVIDQFEELFTLCDDPTARQEFVNRLLALIKVPDPPHRVILTMRSDFEAFIARLRDLQPVFEAGRVQVTPLSAAEMHEAIERPAEAIGLKFETGVVDLLLQDILGEPAGLPLLQFTLLKLWEQRERNRITRAAYERVGGGRQALARSADEFYNALLPEEQVTARRILLRMVRPGEGLEVTSSRIRRTDLYRGGEDPGRVDRVLVKLIGAHLVRLTEGETPDDTQIEVAHEALVRNWPTLIDWLEEEKVALATRRRLEGRATEWVRLGRGAGGLLDEIELREAERWLAGPEAAYLGNDQALPELVVASRAALVEAEAAEYERQRALMRAEAQAATRRRLTALVYALAIVSLLAIAIAVYALIQRNQVAFESNQRAMVVVQLRTAEVNAQQQAQTAEAARRVSDQLAQTAEVARRVSDEQARIARASELAVRAQAALPNSPQQSLLFAARANTIALDAGEQPTLAARQALYTALGGAGGRGLSGHSGRVTALAFSLDSRWLATGSDDTTILVWELRSDGAHRPRRLAGHTRPITALAFSPDSHWLASASQDATARLWDLNTTDPATTSRTLTGHTNSLRTVAFNTDGHWLVTAGDDAIARLWDIANPAAPAVPLRGHTGAIWSASFSPDGKWLITGGLDGTARVWDLAHPNVAAGDRVLGNQGSVLTRLVISPDSHWLITSSADRIIRRWDLTNPDPNADVVLLQGHREDISALAISPDGRLLASGGGRDSVRLWELNADNPNTGTRELTGFSGSLTTLAFSSDSRWLAGGASDQIVRLWDLQAVSSDAKPRSLPGHEADVTALAFSADGHWLASGSQDATVRIWDWPHHDDTAVARVLDGHQKAINAIALSADGRRLATASDDATTWIWDTTAPDPNAAPIVLRGDTDRIYASAMRPDGQYLYTAGADGIVREWNLNAADPNNTVRTFTGHTAPIAALALSPDGRHLVSGSYDATARVWDLTAPNPSAALIVLRGHTNQVLAAAFSPTGRYVATASYDTTARLWDITAPDPNTASLVLKAHTAPITTLAFSPDGQWLATAGDNGELWLWDVTAPDPNATGRKLSGHVGAVVALAFSPDAHHLASAGEDSVIRIWDLVAPNVGTLIHELKGHDRSVFTLAFGADSKQLVSGGSDQTMRLWNFSDADAPGMLILGQHAGSVFHVAFLPNRSTIVSAGQDGTARLWELRIQPLVMRACATAGRNLRPAEWNLFFPDQPYQATCPATNTQ